MTAKVVAKCWICGAAATSGEHKTKRTDLQLAFGKPTQAKPLFLHDDKRANRLVRSLKADILKSSGRICADCNNARTQAHDQAWETMSAHIHSRRLALKPGDAIRGSHVFRHDTKQKMLAMHLYFLKLFGCMIMEADRPIPIDLKPFADAILNGHAHPHVYLKFAPGMGYIGRSNLELQHADNFKKMIAAWMYQLDWITVIVMYATPSERMATHMRRGLTNAWHPTGGTNKLVFDNIEPEQATKPHVY